MGTGERITSDRLFSDRGWRPVPVRMSALHGLGAQGESRSLETQAELQRHLRSLIDGPASQQAAEAV